MSYNDLVVPAVAMGLPPRSPYRMAPYPATAIPGDVIELQICALGDGTDWVGRASSNYRLLRWIPAATVQQVVAQFNDDVDPLYCDGDVNSSVDW